jgi:putative resolvase
MKQKYIKLSEYAKNKSITYKTAWTHFGKGLIKGAFKDDSGHVLIPIVNDFDYSNVVLYARVSSNEMKENLKRQEQRLNEYAIRNNYNIIKSIKEIGSGMNDNRPKLISLLNDNSWSTLIVENKDRLTRFGFNYLKTLLEKNNKKIIVINQNELDNQNLMEDLVSIIYSFSARMYGLRRKKNKEEIIKFIES